jgi:hypothetical protein
MRVNGLEEMCKSDGRCVEAVRDLDTGDESAISSL